MPWFALFVFGVAVGALSGLLGIGGGVILVPGLMLLFGFSQPAAQGTSLSVLSLPILASAAFMYYRAGHVHWPVVVAVAAGFAAGAVGGAKFVDLIPATILRLLFAGLLFYVAFMMALEPRVGRTKAALPAFLAAAVSSLVARLLHRKFRATAPLDPPDGHTEYHI